MACPVRESAYGAAVARPARYWTPCSWPHATPDLLLAIEDRFVTGYFAQSINWLGRTPRVSARSQMLSRLMLRSPRSTLPT